MKIRDEKGNVTKELGFWETTGEVAEATAVALVGFGGVLAVGFLAVIAISKGAEYVVNGAHKLITGKDEDEEPASEGKPEQPAATEQDKKFADMFSKLEEKYKELSEETEGLRKENKQLKKSAA